MLSAALLTAGQYAGAIVVLVSVVVIMWRAVKFFNRYEERADKIEKIVVAAADQLTILGSLQDLIDQPMMMLDEHGFVIAINMATHRLLGYSVEDLKNGHFKPRLDWGSQQAWASAMKDKRLFERVCKLVSSDGTQLTVTLIAKPIRTETKFLGYRCSIDPMMGDAVQES